MLSGTGPTGLSGLPLSTIKRPRRARRLLATQAGASTLSGSMVSDVSYLSTGPAALGDDHHAQAHHAHGVGGGASSQPPSRGVNTSRFTLQPQSFYGGVTDLAAPNRPAAAATGHFTPPAEPSRHLVAQRVSAAEASLSQLHRGLRTMLSPASVAAPSATHGAAAQKRSAARIAELEAKVAGECRPRPCARVRVTSHLLLLCCAAVVYGWCRVCGAAQTWLTVRAVESAVDRALDLGRIWARVRHLRRHLTAQQTCHRQARRHVLWCHDEAPAAATTRKSSSGYFSCRGRLRH